MNGGKMKQRVSYMLGAIGHDTYYAAISTFFYCFCNKSNVRWF